ncbi:MAG TPA: hypothetical protein VIG54_08800, partial [Lysobacter sp.]
MIRFLPLCLLAGTAAAQAQDASRAAVELDRVQVIATRAPRAVEATPAAVSVLQGDALDTAGHGASLSETLAGV